MGGAAQRKTTMFRRLYWVTEQVGANGESKVTGVYTSIPNLLREGFACNDLGNLRLTLMKLDSENGALGSWTGPTFEGLDSSITEFVKTDEFTAEHCETLVGALANGKANV